VTRTAWFAGWCVFLATTLWMLHAVGGADLGPPPSRPGDWREYVSNVGPDVAVAAIIRLAAVALNVYLIVVTVAGATARRGGHLGVTTVLDGLLPAFVRRLLAGAGGLTVSAAGLTLAVVPLIGPGSSPTVYAETRPAENATLRRATPNDVARLARSSGLPEVATLTVFKFDPAPFAVIGPGSTDIAADALQPATERHMWPVAAGDSFWSIAKEHLEEIAPRADMDQLHAHWRRLIDVNRHRLVDPTTPDLIYPGQVFELPDSP
jgi:hypothetical protein